MEKPDFWKWMNDKMAAKSAKAAKPIKKKRARLTDDNSWHDVVERVPAVKTGTRGGCVSLRLVQRIGKELTGTKLGDLDGFLRDIEIAKAVG